MIKNILIALVLCLTTPLLAKSSIPSRVDELMKEFQQNPSDYKLAVQLLQECNKYGIPDEEILETYFSTQSDEDYLKDYNWQIVRDYVNDLNAKPIKFIFNNTDKFVQRFSKEDVFQKLDNLLIDYLSPMYNTDKIIYNAELQKLKTLGYAHHDVVSDYFGIKELRLKKASDDYFYKARKLFRYFPENKVMIKEITEGAIEIMTDVSRLKVIQLWARKTVEQTDDFDALYNYALISNKCGFPDVAKKYALMADKLANAKKDDELRKRALELANMFK